MQTSIPSLLSRLSFVNIGSVLHFFILPSAIIGVHFKQGGVWVKIRLIVQLWIRWEINFGIQALTSLNKLLLSTLRPFTGLIPWLRPPQVCLHLTSALSFLLNVYLINVIPVHLVMGVPWIKLLIKSLPLWEYVWSHWSSPSFSENWLIFFDLFVFTFSVRRIIINKLLHWHFSRSTNHSITRHNLHLCSLIESLVHCLLYGVEALVEQGPNCRQPSSALVNKRSSWAPSLGVAIPSTQ